VAMVAVGIVGVSLLLACLWHFSRSEDAGEFAAISSGQTVQEAEPGEAQLASIGAVLQGRDVVEEAAPEAGAQLALWSGLPPETLLPTAQLLGRRKYGYSQATFSFEYGTRDDPGGIVRNDWDILFSGEGFRVSMVTDDRSVIVDLGEIRLADVHPGLLEDAEQGEKALPKLGHSYLVWTRDTGTDLVSAFEVVDLKLKESCELNWYTVNGNGQASGSFHDDGVGPPLVETMEALRHSFQASNVLTAPRIFLQARAGHQGGNPCRINGLGEVNAYFDGVSKARLDVMEPIGRKTKSLGFAEGGAIPAGMLFMVQRVTYRGEDRDGESGRGGFEIHIGGQSIVPKDYAKDLSLMVWTGSIPVRAGFESDLTLMASYFTQGEALIEGAFMPDEGLQQAGELLANGMRLFPRAEIPSGQGLRFSSGQVLESTRRGPGLDMVFDGEGVSFGRAQLHDLGESMMGQAVLDPLSEAATRKFGPLQTGHCYLMVQPLGRATFFRVEALNPGISCTIDWFSVNSQGQQAGSLSDTGDDYLARSIVELRRAARKHLELKQPLVHLQLRVQHVGGNPCKVTMDGNSRYLKLSKDPLVVTGVPSHRDEEQSFCEGGLVPEGQIFVVSHVEYRVFRDFDGDDKKHPVKIRVGQTYVLAEKDLAGNLNNVWTGRVEIKPGSETSVFIEGTYNTAIDVKIRGEFIPDPKAKAR
ncbi:MAG: hypothetical protein JKY61_05335, partial [Planctomycetes bacterium]|nr:hypothetical protein [Planctomycetota bacterium]